jgi:hypothetical protein
VILAFLTFFLALLSSNLPQAQHKVMRERERDKVGKEGDILQAPGDDARGDCFGRDARSVWHLGVDTT